jgi:CoA:oxalate CoA-transferase
MGEQTLANLKILDLTRFVAGPYCTRILAGLGAEVIKVERPGLGDTARSNRPFLEDKPDPERSGLFLYLNSSKKSITLDLSSDTGKRLLRELAADADVVLEDLRPGKMNELGLGFESLQELNPSLVMTSISGFGQSGPYRDYRMNHLTAWGMSGHRYCDGAQGVRPVQMGGWITHYITGLFATTGTLVAIFEKNATRKGRHVDISMWQSNLLTHCFATSIYSFNGLLHNWIGMERLGILQCKDGFVGVNIYGRLNWDLLCAFFQMPELADDPRFKTSMALLENFEEAKAIVTEKIKDREKAELFESGVEWRIPFGLVPSAEELLATPHLRERNFFQEIEHPVIGKVELPGAPFRMSETAWQSKTAAPLLGQHNEEIYGRRLGYSPAELMRMREHGII